MSCSWDYYNQSLMQTPSKSSVSKLGNKQMQVRITADAGKELVSVRCALKGHGWGQWPMHTACGSPPWPHDYWESEEMFLCHRYLELLLAIRGTSLPTAYSCGAETEDMNAPCRTVGTEPRFHTATPLPPVPREVA